MRLRDLAFAIVLFFVAACSGTELTPYPLPSVANASPSTGGCPVPVAKQKTFIPFGGLRTDVDEKLLPAGSTLQLQNGLMSKMGKVAPRSGTTALSTNLIGTTDSLPPTWSLGNLSGCLVSFSTANVKSHPVNSYSPSALAWATDPFTNGVPSATKAALRTSKLGPIVPGLTRVSGTGQRPDMDYASGFYFVTYVDVVGSTVIIWQTGIDATTGKKVFERSVNDGLSNILNYAVRVVNGYAVFARDTTANDIAFDAWQISNLDAGPTTTTFATTAQSLTGSTMSDMIAKDATTVSFIYLDNTNHVQGIDFVPSTSTASGWTLNDSSPATVVSDLALNWM